jgi:hypothetical protein
MSRFATILFPPVLALALMSGLGTFATFTSVAFADDPVDPGVPTSTFDCKGTSCYITDSTSGCPAFACSGDLNNCNGCADYYSEDGPYCGCAGNGSDS